MDKRTDYADRHYEEWQEQEDNPMTDLAAHKDQFRASLSGQLARIEQHLADVVESILTYNREAPHTILEGDRTTLDQARIAVRTIRRGIDAQRGVKER